MIKKSVVPFETDRKKIKSINIIKLNENFDVQLKDRFRMNLTREGMRPKTSVTVKRPATSNSVHTRPPIKRKLLA